MASENVDLDPLLGIGQPDGFVVPVYDLEDDRNRSNLFDDPSPPTLSPSRKKERNTTTTTSDGAKTHGYDDMDIDDMDIGDGKSLRTPPTTHPKPLQ